jgi:hypothetical protein
MQKGCSVMIYPTSEGKMAFEGDLAYNFKENLKELKKQASREEILGWKLINETIPLSNILRYSTSTDQSILSIEFLDPQCNEE